MGAGASCSTEGNCAPNGKASKATAEAAKEFKAAVYRCAGIDTCGSMADTALKLEDFFKVVDTNHNGTLDHDEIDGLLMKLQQEIPPEYKDIIQSDIKKDLLLNFAGSPFNALFKAFTTVKKTTLVSTEPKRIVFVGGTGAGKSLLCTVLTGQEKKTSEFTVGDSATSETTACKSKVCRWFGDENEDQFVCIDTPGLDDELGRDELHINMIVDILQEFKYVNSIVFVINGTSLRFSTSMQNMIKKFEGSFGSRFYEHCMLCLTRWSMDEDSIEERAEKNQTEESVTLMMNTKLKESQNLRCSAELPVVFVDSIYKRKDPKNGKSRLRKIQELTTSTVFRTEELAKVRPKIVEVTNSDQQLQTRSKVFAMEAKTFDREVTVKLWTIEPSLPDGLILCPEGGKIYGMPTKISPVRTYQIVASSIGGASEPFPIGLEVIHSPDEIKQLVITAGLDIFYEVGKIFFYDEVRARDADEVNAKVAEARKIGEDLLAVQLKELEKEHGEVSSFPKVIETLQEYFKSEFISHEKQFLQHNQQTLSVEKAKQSAESDLKIALLQKTTNAKKLSKLIQNASEAGVDPELIKMGKSSLEDISMCACKNKSYGCNIMKMGRDMQGHEAMCLFSLPLLSKASAVRVPGKSSTTPASIIVKAESAAKASWDGVYEWDNGEYYLMNSTENRIQRIRPAVEKAAVGKASLEWILTAQTEEDGPQAEIAKSSKKSVSVVDADFDGFSISPPMAYSWADSPTYVKCEKSSVTLIYFGGKWCPYCPPFTAKLKKFYESIVAQKGPGALQIIFCSSDQDEKAMFEYYMEEHGDWLAIPYKERGLQKALSENFDVKGIPKCLLVNSSMENITEKLDLREMLGKISPLPGTPHSEFVLNAFDRQKYFLGPKQDEDHLRMFLQLEQLTKIDGLKASGDALPPGDGPTDIFCSLRFGSSMNEAKLVQHQLKEAHDINAVIIDVPEGKDIAEEVAVKIDEAKLVLIFGCETYGLGTVSYSTKQELEFVLSEKKPYFLIKMCDRFKEARTRFVFHEGISYCKWKHGDPMPANLIPDIVKRFTALG